MQLRQKTLDIDGEKIVCEYLVKDVNAIILHGAGQAERSRYYAVANELLKHGIGVVLFDFSGHGESTGRLSELSLHRRKRQARQVIDELIPAGKLYLVGFSMGGQTLCDLLSFYPKRIEAVLLACPAIYTSEVHSLPFGRSDFTKKLREGGSWKKSDAPKALKNFKGRTVIAIGSEDEVIPSGVVDLLKDSAQELVYREYAGVTHALSRWLASYPKELSELINELVAGGSNNIVAVKQSPISGKGLFAKRLIRQGETVLSWHPKVLSREQADKLPEEEKRHYLDPDGDKLLWMQPPERYMNHSCEPNTQVVGWSDVAARDIKPGEEITSDYLDHETSNSKCHCGSKKCRRPA